MINPIFRNWINPARYKVAYGGRGSSKSWSIAELLIEIARRTPVRVLCTRELQVSISDSVIQLLSDTIERLGYLKEFNIQRNVIYHYNGSIFLFYGLKTNTTKIKSLEGVDICWCEESENISDESWNILIPTIRKEGSEIWVSFNPANILDPTYVRFIEETPNDCILTKVNYTDNPYFPETLRLEMEALKEKDYDLYLHIWEGEPVADSEHAFIKPAWIATAIDAHLKLEPFKNNVGRKVIGFDVADEGDDANALTYMEGSIIKYSESWKRGDVGESTRRIFSDASRLDSKVIYDAIGVGAGVKAESNRLNNSDPLRKVRFVPFVAGGAVDYPDSEVDVGIGRTNKDFFANVKAQVWWTARQRFYNTYLAITKGREFEIDELISLSSENQELKQLTAELSRPKIDYDNNGRVKVESKKDLAKRGIKSPNLADSLIMCFYPDNQEIFVW